jgi:hypothetical protein
MIGGEAVAKRIDVFATALHAHMTLAQIEDLDLSYAPPFAPVYDPILIAANVGVKQLAKPLGTSDVPGRHGETKRILSAEPNGKSVKARV